MYVHVCGVWRFYILGLYLLHDIAFAILDYMYMYVHALDQVFMYMYMSTCTLNIIHFVVNHMYEAY